MSLNNAVMYLQNVLVAIQMEINCKVRYSIFFRYIARSNILQMQNSYDEAHSKSNSGLNFPDQQTAASEQEKSSKDSQSCAYGDDNFKFELPDFPLSQGALNEFSKVIDQNTATKYSAMVRNVHFYLCYIFLELQDYSNAVRHGLHVVQEFWPKKQISVKTYFTV